MLLELSYPISENIPVYPGSPAEKIKPINRMSNGDVCNTTVLVHYIHAGTHVDAPFHFSKNGKYITELPIEDFRYTKSVVIECKLSKSGLITREKIEKNPKAKDAEILFFDTGYCEKRADAAVYADDFPALSEEAALYIRNELLNVKAVAIDTLSIESAILGPANNFPVHKALLDSEVSSERTVLIYEDVNTALLRGRKVSNIFAFPLRLEGVDGSPVNIVAEVDA